MDQNHLDEFAHRTVSCLGSGDEPAPLADRGLRVGGGGRKACNLSAGQSLTSSPMKQISVQRELGAPATLQGAGFILAPLFELTGSFWSRSDRSADYPRPRSMSPSARFSRQRYPMMSANGKRFHSSPLGPHQTQPSVRTPSTSIAIGLIANACSHSAQFLRWAVRVRIRA